MTKEAVAEGESNGVVIDDVNDINLKSSNIVIKNVTSNYFATDGFYIRGRGEKISILNCKGNYNGRQGLSIVGGKNITIDNCVFDSTGFTGKYGSHAPTAGIDVESELGNAMLRDVTIKNCTMRSNKGFQIVTTLQSENVKIDSCFFSDLEFGRGGGLNGIGMYSLNSTLSNSIIFGTVQIDLAGQLYTGPLKQIFKNNIIYSGYRALISSDFARPCDIVGNVIIMLPNPSMNEYFPYIQNPNCRFNDNVIVQHATKVSLIRNEVNALVQSTKETKNNTWLLNGYSVAEKGQRKYYYFPAFNGGADVGAQYFPPNDKIASFNYSFFKFITALAVDKILSYNLINAYKQTSFNKKYLVDAHAIRNYLKGIQK